MFAVERKVRYSDISQDGHADIARIADYFQDCGSEHSDSVGGGADVLTAEYGCVWLLNSWQITVSRYPVYGEDLRVCTIPYAFDRVFANRNFVIYDEKGEMIVKANSCWFLYDIHTGMPLRMVDGVRAGYVLDDKIEMDYAPRKIRVSGNEAETADIHVEKYEIDTNHHMNNAWYIRLAMQYLPEDYVIKQVRAEYRNAARLGDTVRIFTETRDNKKIVVMKDLQGGIYAVLEFAE